MFYQVIARTKNLGTMLRETSSWAEAKRLEYKLKDWGADKVVINIIHNDQFERGRREGLI